MTTPERDAHPIFGLHRDVLQPILTAAAGEPVADFDVATRPLSRGHYGAEGDKLIATCRYNTRSGRSGSIDLFCKCCCRPGPSEAHHYEYLHSRGMPLPRYFGSSLDLRGHEVLFLEHLDTVFGDDDLLRQPDLCTEFLQTLARINAKAVSPDYARVLGSGDIGGIVAKDLAVLDELADLASGGALGPGLRQLLGCRAADRLKAVALPLAAAATAMPHGLIHGDYFPRHIGRRRDDSTLLVFDWAHAGLAARFLDVATFVGCPENESGLALSAEQAATAYLDAYAASGGPQMPLDVFLQENRTLWLAWNFRCLRWWLPKALKNDERSPQARNDLARLLDILLRHR
jgi:hypothetical protein